MVSGWLHRALALVCCHIGRAPVVGGWVDFEICVLSFRGFSSAEKGKGQERGFWEAVE